MKTVVKGQWDYNTDTVSLASLVASFDVKIWSTNSKSYFITFLFYDPLIAKVIIAKVIHILWKLLKKTFDPLYAVSVPVTMAFQTEFVVWL